MELSIDTSTRYASVALTRHGDLLAEVSWHSQQNHTVELAPSVQHLLDRVGLHAKDLQAVFVALGPGGFSALRVGAGFAKGLAEGLGIPLLGVGTLEVEAHPYASTGLPIYAVLDAARGQVAWAVYQATAAGWSQRAGERLGTLQELAATVTGPVVVCGEGLAVHVQALRAYLGPQALVAYAPPPTRRATTVARLGYERLARGERQDPSTLQPLYLRRPSITLPGERRGGVAAAGAGIREPPPQSKETQV